MGCCSKSSTRPTPAPLPYLPGEAGFVLVEYLGDDDWYIVNSDETDSGAYYVFGRNRRLGFVDKFDAGTRKCKDKTKLMARRNGSGYLFRRSSVRRLERN